MYKKIVWDKLGGYPLTQADMAFLQDSYRDVLGSLTGLIGDKVIISGLQQNGSEVSTGWISINGEIVPFLAGNLGTEGRFIIDQELANVVFKDGVSKTTRIKRFARFSEGGLYKFSDLKRPVPMREVWQRGDIKQVDCSEEELLNILDLGTGLCKGDRLGWAVCDGRNGTRNRGGRISIGYSIHDIDPGDDVWDAIYHVIGATGGSKLRQLIVDNLPKHRFKLFSPGVANGENSDPIAANTYVAQALEAAGNLSHRQKRPTNGAVPTLGLSSEVGGDIAFSLMNPFIVTLEIMKL